jgi:Zn-finger nucleic acid-binding protein
MMRCTACDLPLDTLHVDDVEIVRCGGCGAVAVPDLVLAALLVPEAASAERVLVEAELAAVGAGEAVSVCLCCGSLEVRLGEVRGVWIGRCGRCRAISFAPGDLEELRWKVRDDRHAEIEETLEEMTTDGGRRLAGELVGDAGVAAVRWWRQRERRLAGRRAAEARARAAARLPVPEGADDPPV